MAGMQGVYRHASAATGTPMTFSVFVPPHEPGARLPVVWFLSGLTCTHANVTEKGEYRARLRQAGPDLRRARHLAAWRGRARAIPTAPTDFGLGAGFYVDATQAPYAANYNMWSYVTRGTAGPDRRAISEADMGRQSIMGHSMGGHGALTIGLSFPDRFRAVSAFAPIVAPVAGAMGPGRRWQAISARTRRHGASMTRWR